MFSTKCLSSICADKVFIVIENDESAYTDDYVRSCIDAGIHILNFMLILKENDGLKLVFSLTSEI